jgi:hypothetical protein
MHPLKLVYGASGGDPRPPLGPWLVYECQRTSYFSYRGGSRLVARFERLQRSKEASKQP